MGLREAFSRVAAVSWFGLVVGAWIAVDLGLTEPWLTFADVPGGSTGGAVGALVALVAGWVVLGRWKAGRERAEWKEAGRQAGLHPADGGGETKGPPLTGTVDGRTVTAAYDRRKVGGSEESGGSHVTFTVAEAALAGPADEGVVVGNVGDSYARGAIGSLDFEAMAETAPASAGLVTAETGGLVLVGSSTAAVDAVAGGLSGEAIRAVRDLEIAAVGDASGVVATWAEARNEEMEGVGSSLAEHPVDRLVGHVPGDAATVTVETRASIRDGDELRRFAEGAVAVADALEAATGEPSAPG